MKVCLLSVAQLGDDPSDPPAQHTRRLAARDDVDVTLALFERSADAIGDALRVTTLERLAGERFDVALALDWRATTRLYELDAERYALFVGALEHRTLDATDADRILAMLALDLPLDLVAGAAWIADELRALRPEARVFTAAPGLEHGQFATVRPGARAGGPLHVLVDARAGASRLAGAALLAMGGEHRVDALEPGHDGPARLARYLEADVVLQLDTPEGALGAPLEAMAAGIPCVIAAGPDSADLVNDGDNGVLVSVGDAAGASRALDRMAADRDHLAHLAAGALATGGAWPGWDVATAALEGALEQIVAAPPPAAALRPLRLMADADAAVGLFRTQFNGVEVAYERLRNNELVRAGEALRGAYRSPLLAAVRRAARPLVGWVRKRLEPRE